MTILEKKRFMDDNVHKSTQEWCAFFYFIAVDFRSKFTLPCY